MSGLGAKAAEPVIAVHGGAWAIPPRWRAEAAAVCGAAAKAGHAVLEAGGAALDAVCVAVRLMEDAPVLDAGVGSAPDAAGDYTLDASIMRGADLACGAVAGVPPTRHVIDLARAVLEHSPHVLLIGRKALEWGAAYGIEPCSPSALDLPAAYAAEPPYLDGGDTVGAVARDAAGALAAATSTGGVPGAHPARVGDAPLIGCGTYCDDAIGAAISTGKGEAIIRVSLARSVIEALARGERPSRAARRLVEAMTARTGGRGGAVALDREGRVGLWHTTSAMAWGVARSNRVHSGHRVPPGLFEPA